MTCMILFNVLECVFITRGEISVAEDELFPFHESAKKEEDVEEESLQFEPTIQDPRLRQQ